MTSRPSPAWAWAGAQAEHHPAPGGNMVIHRYMSADRHARIVAHVFWPEELHGRPLTDETLGTASFVTRDNPRDSWDAPRVIADGITYGAWKARVEADHFIYGDDCERP